MNLAKTSVGLEYDDERFTSKYDEGPGCWLWHGTITRTGYGVFAIVCEGRVRQFPAHRVSFERRHGEVPGELHIDHICRVRNCVNPEHLRAVTPRVNTLAGIGFSAINARKTHCPMGHEYTPENTYQYRNMRMCRTCKAARQKAYRELRRTGVGRDRATCPSCARFLSATTPQFSHQANCPASPSTADMTPAETQEEV